MQPIFLIIILNWFQDPVSTAVLHYIIRGQPAFLLWTPDQVRHDEGRWSSVRLVSLWIGESTA